MEKWVKYDFNGITYNVSNYGNIIGVRGRLLKQRLNSDGYLIVTLGNNEEGRQSIRVHRLIATLFVNNPNNLPEVNHLDCNRANARWDNLEWCTHADNVAHSIALGNYDNIRHGELNGRAKLTYKLVKEIRDLYDNKTYTIQELSVLYKTPWSTISHVVNRSTWNK